MKKILIIILLIIPIKVCAISASSAIVMDINNNRILYEKNIDDQRLIASTTKIMTCLVTIENIDLDKEIVVGEEVLKAYGSAIYIEVGEKLTIKDLLMGLMLRSGNDAALVIAKAVANDMDSFVILMNKKAKEIGMNNTIFYNNHGLEQEDGKGNLSTAYDMALLTSYAMKNNTFKKIFGTKKYTTKTNYKSYSWKSKNKLIHQLDYITGGKTGYTKKARRTLVTTASKNNIDLVIVTLNDPNDFQDHKSLYESIFNKYSSLVVLDKDNFKIKKDDYYKDKKLYIKNNYFVTVTDEEKNKLNIKYILEKNNRVKNGDIVGKANIYLDNELLHTENIYVMVKKNSFWHGWFKW